MHTPDIHKNIKFAGVFKIRVSLYEYRQEGQVTFVNDEAVFFFVHSHGTKRALEESVYFHGLSDDIRLHSIYAPGPETTRHYIYRPCASYRFPNNTRVAVKEKQKNLSRSSESRPRLIDSCDT